MRTLIPRHSRTMTVGEAPLFVDPTPPARIQTPDGLIYVNQELVNSQRMNSILLGAAGGIGAGILGSWLVRKL